MVSSRVERRSGKRFPIRMALSYRLSRERKPISEGSGTTVDISSTGVLFRTGGVCPQDAAAELFIDWPALYDNAVPLKLAVVGLVVRSDRRGTAVQIVRYRLRSLPKVTPPGHTETEPTAGTDSAADAKVS